MVITPSHVTDFFCELANITENNIVYDPCCGSGGFLIAAMKKMLKLAGNDEKKREKIKNLQLVGVERRPDMFTYACSNMLFRGDGKSNVYNKDCFNVEELIEQEHQPDVVFLNPPYDVGVVGQMEFIEHSLNVVTKTNGIVIGIVQMSCAIKHEKALISLKKRLLKKHKLKAVISMPDDLFHPIGVIACIMVWEANKPNKGYETWFGYLMDDGYEKRKHKGRIDVKSKWKDIKDSFINSYRNQKEVKGLSIKKEVSEQESWLAQSYLVTDYNSLTQRHFEDTIRNHLSFLIRSKYIDISSNSIINEIIELATSNWKYYSFNKLFLAKKGKRLTKEDMFDGETPYVSSSSLNNGVECYISENPIFTGMYLSFACYGSIGEVFYHSYDAWVSDNCNVLYLKKPYEMNVYNAMFLCTVLGLEKYRFGYGYTGKLNNINQLQIKLPADKNGKPDWKFMEDYIKSLPYSSSL